MWKNKNKSANFGFVAVELIILLTVILGVAAATKLVKQIQNPQKQAAGCSGYCKPNSDPCQSGYKMIGEVGCGFGRYCCKKTTTSTITPYKSPTSVPTKPPSDRRPTRPPTQATKAPTIKPTAISTKPPTTSSTCVNNKGQCYWGSSSCSTLGRYPVSGSCGVPGAPVACCGSVIPNVGQGACTKGLSYCSPTNTSIVKVCRSDKSGYIDVTCTSGTYCPFTGTKCIPFPKIPSKTPFPTPTKTKLELFGFWLIDLFNPKKTPPPSPPPGDFIIPPNVPEWKGQTLCQINQGKCYWGANSCSTLGLRPAAGSCQQGQTSAPVVCCLDTTPLAIIPTPSSYFSPKANLFQSCKFHFECQSNYCNSSTGKCDLNTDEINQAIQDYTKNYGMKIPGYTSGSQPPSSFIVPGWSGLDKSTENYLNKIIDNIVNYDKYCSSPGSSPYADYKKCLESISTGISLALIVAAPGLAPVVPETVLALPSWIIKTIEVGGAVSTGVGIGYYQYQCGQGDTKACAIAQDLATGTYAGFTTYAWNIIPEGLNHPEYGRVIDVDIDDNATTVIPAGLIDFKNEDYITTVIPPPSYKPPPEPVAYQTAGRGSYATTYQGPNGSLLKIYSDPKLPVNQGQMNFYKTYTGSHPWISYRKPVYDVYGDVIGFDSNYWSNTLTWKDFVNNGGRLTEAEIQNAVNEFAGFQAVVGGVHGDLFRWPNNSLIDPKYWQWEQYGWLHPKNILVQTLSDGSRKIIPIDFAGWDGTWKYLFPPQYVSLEDALRIERRFFEEGLKKFSAGY